MSVSATTGNKMALSRTKNSSGQREFTKFQRSITLTINNKRAGTSTKLKASTCLPFTNLAGISKAPAISVTANHFINSKCSPKTANDKTLTKIRRNCREIFTLLIICYSACSVLKKRSSYEINNC